MNSQVYRRVRHDLLSNTVTLVCKLHCIYSHIFFLLSIVFPFLANLGSAFSLFVGMSMVSAIEIFYYFTVILRKFYKQECNARELLLFRKSNLVQNGNSDSVASVNNVEEE